MGGITEGRQTCLYVADRFYTEIAKIIGKGHEG